MKPIVAPLLFISILLAAMFGFINSPTALFLGFTFSLFFEHPFKKYSQNAIQILLKASIIGLGFGMYLKDTLETSKEGLGLTFFSIVLTVSLGFLLTRLLKIDTKLGHLITSGTSICGGSAIAAISPVIRANGKTISIALGVVFTLNAIALFIFPALGHLFDLDQHQFGLWCAIAIHDTSSVVGAALGYGDEALRIATTVKLSRTLWIIPLSVLSMFIFKTKGEHIKIPYFILLFMIAIGINSYNLVPEAATHSIVAFSKKLLILTLFLVGTTISIKDLKATGYKPILLAFCLWIFIAVFSFLYITN
ncbi:putative sulfate exporter family transporter [Cellulophaga sp. E16_2]|uniref:YeiH family protein n=1 Tax=Cellulophaga sp. E16_2 TaxID=2789297 RepID=UPI001A923757|nr:putative sulfate exporter family transporter [Cellulophaga sp. E16_2]MBO0593764.1 putative sulfate exporter family transporter [Cellulophaga sp. E16_2]